MQMEGMVPKKLLMNKSRELNRVNSCNDKGSSVTCHAYMCDRNKNGAEILEWIYVYITS